MMHHLLDGERTHPLPAIEQMRMVTEYHRTKDPALERKLIEANVRLVMKLARQLDRTHGRSLEDLVQEGCLGLIEGIRRFDPTKGARLTTYAAFWIRAYIMKYTMDNVRVVRSVRGREGRMNFFRGVVAAAEVSFDRASGPDAAPIGDFLADPATPVDRVLEMAELSSGLKRSAAQLEQRLRNREATILRERLLAAEPTPRQVVAKRMCLSSERVRQIERALQAAIRTELGADDLAAAA